MTEQASNPSRCPNPKCGSHAPSVRKHYEPYANSPGYMVACDDPWHNAAQPPVAYGKDVSTTRTKMSWRDELAYDREIESEGYRNLKEAIRLSKIAAGGAHNAAQPAQPEPQGQRTCPTCGMDTHCIHGICFADKREECEKPEQPLSSAAINTQAPRGETGKPSSLIRVISLSFITWLQVFIRRTVLLKTPGMASRGLIFIREKL
jgi:hypothetical protein